MDPVIIDSTSTNRSTSPILPTCINCSPEIHLLSPHTIKNCPFATFSFISPPPTLPNTTPSNLHPITDLSPTPPPKDVFIDIPLSPPRSASPTIKSPKAKGRFPISLPFPETFQKNGQPVIATSGAMILSDLLGTSFLPKMTNGREDMRIEPSVVETRGRRGGRELGGGGGGWWRGIWNGEGKDIEWKKRRRLLCWAIGVAAVLCLIISVTAWGWWVGVRGRTEREVGD